MSRAEYTFVTTDLLTGALLGEVELTAIHWEDIRNRPGGGSATTRLDLPTSTTDYFRSWSSALWALKGGEVQFGALIGGVQPRGGTRVLHIPLHGFMEYFRNQFVKGSQGMLRAISRGSRGVRWNDVDQFEIVRDLILHAQAFERTNINVDVVWDSLSGVLRDQTYYVHEAKPVAEAIEQIGERNNGYDWWQEYYVEDGVPRVRFRLAAQRTRQASYILRHETEHNVQALVATQYGLELPGIPGSNVTTATEPQSPSVDYLGAEIVFNPEGGWRPKQDITLLSQYDEDTDTEHFSLVLQPSGHLRWSWRDADGTYDTVASTKPVPFMTGEHGVGVEMATTAITVPGSGAWIEDWEEPWNDDQQVYQQGITFKIADDGTSWGQLETRTAPAAGLTSDIFGTIEVGSGFGGRQGLWQGTVRWALIHMGNPSAPRYWMDARMQREDIRSFNDVRGNVWTVNGAANFVPVKTVAMERNVGAALRSNVVDYDYDAGEQPIARVVVIGEGEGEAMRYALVEDLTMGTGPAYDIALQQKGVRTNETLTEHGRALLDQRGKIRPQFTLQVDPNASPSYPDVQPGDEVRVIIHDGFTDIDSQCSVFHKKLVFSKNADAQVTLGVYELESNGPVNFPELPGS